MPSIKMVGLEGEVDTGQVAQFMNSEDCKIPYRSNVSDGEQERIRLRIETFLFKTNILSAERITEIHKKHLTPDEWEMIKETPERYWPEVFAVRMTPEERNKVDKGPYIDSVFANPDSEHRYRVSTKVWTGVAESLYCQSHGRLPTPDEEVDIVQTYGGPLHRCFFVFAEPVAGLKVVYGWAQDFFKSWEEFRHRYQETHPPSKNRTAAA